MIFNRDISSDFFIIFRLFLGGLALLHTLWFFMANYPFYVYLENYVQIPIIDILGFVPHFVHTLIYFIMLVASINIIFNKYLILSLAYISFALLYSEFHNYFAFHQDIFLGAIIFFFSVFIFNKEKNKSLILFAILGIQITILILYFAAGINKFDEEFLSGYVITNILQTSFIWGKILSSNVNNENLMLMIGQFACYFSFAVELLFPVLIIFKKTRSIAVLLGIMLHLGIETTGRGMLFNLYIPAMYLLWYTNIKFPEIIINRGGILINNIKNKFLMLISLPLIFLYFFHLFLITATVFRNLLKGLL